MDATTAQKPRRRWFRLSVRGLMLLVLLVGGGIGWKANRVSFQRRAVAAIQEGGGWVRYDFQDSSDLVERRRRLKLKEPPAPRWLRRWVGDDYFQEVVHVTLYEKAPSPDLLGMVAGLDSVTELFLYELPDAAGLVHLRKMPRLRWLVLDGPGITDGAIDEVLRVPSLESLNLDGARVTDAGLARLVAMPRLKSISMGDVPGLTDAGVARLAKLPSIRNLGLRNIPGVGDRVLTALREEHRDMKGLGIELGSLTDAGLANVAGMTNLEGLKFQRSQVTDAGMASLRGLVKLQSLSVSSVGVTDVGIEHLRGLKHLKELSLSNMRITDAGLACVADKVELTTLFLPRTAVTDAGLVHLEKLAKLDNLELTGTAVTDAGLVHLRPLKSLTRLGLRGTKVTPEGVADLRSYIPGVRVTSGPIPPPMKPASPPAAK